jgi:general secretion pathway protein N
MGADAMKRLTLFALALVSPFVAQAGQIPVHGGPDVTAAIEGAPSADRTLIERLQPPAAPAPFIPDAPVKSNPLWSIPLSALSETRDRPLFNIARRPLPPAKVVAVSASKPSAEDKPPEFEAPPFALMGTILTSKARVAVLLDQATSRVTQLRQRKIDSGWTALSVGLRSIVFRKGELQRTLNLPGPNTSPTGAIPSGDRR